MKAVLLALTLAAVVLGAAGAASLALERRLHALAPGGVTVATLHYNPLSGQLWLGDVRARDAVGRELFRAERVVAAIHPWRLFVPPLSLDRAHLTAPRLVLRAAPTLDVAGLAAGLREAHAVATSLPVRIETLSLTGGSLVVEGAGTARAPLVMQDLDLRLGRLTTAGRGQHDVAFAVAMAVHGAAVHVTGQPRGAGYALRVRARGLDVAGLARDLGVRALAGLQQGRGEVDVELVLGDGRLLASGVARVTDLLLTLPVSGRPRLRAATLAVVLDHVDLASGAGRVTRLDLGGARLALPGATAAPTLAELLEPLRSRPGLHVRRIAVTDGALALGGRGGVRLERLQLTARTPELHGDGTWLVRARAAVGGDAEIALEGVVARDLRELDLLARLQHLAVAPWRTLTGVPAGSRARVSFDGRLRVVVREGSRALTLAGEATLADVAGTGRALRDLDLSLGSAGVAGRAHLRLSAFTEVGNRLDVERIVPYEASLGSGVPLGLLLSAFEEAVRTAPVAGVPSAMPAGGVSP